MAPDRGSEKSKKQSSRAWEALSPSLSPWILDAVASMNFTRMTPVQASTIPLFMAHKDVVVEAVTGSGKTLAFLIPIVERILRTGEARQKHHVNAIIISPTRELAAQIYRVLVSLLDFHGPSAAHMRLLKRKYADTGDLDDEPEQNTYPKDALKVVPQLLQGGSSTAAQDLSLFLKTSPSILVSTPGRLLELISSPYVLCTQSSFEVLVLDEADRLLDLGFKDDITKIISLLPKQRRTGLFSASVSEAVDQIIRVGLRNPVRIAVKVKGADGAQDKRTPASLRLTYAIAQASQQLPAVGRILHQLAPTPLRTIIYLSTCRAVDYFQSLVRLLMPDNFQLFPLHGQQLSNVREKNFAKFVNSTTPAVLLATDVAARGLDIPEVDLVIQIDPPSDPKAFLHRCGRAGRAGRKGLSVVFLHPGREEDYISFLEVRKTPIEPFQGFNLNISNEIALATADRLREHILRDRALHEKAQQAFVSWLRSYSKHQASSIFRVADLDWADLATGWALLKMPKMPELRAWDKSLFTPPSVQWETYAYADPQREKKRLLEIASEVGNPRNEGDRKRTTSQAWSGNLEKRADKSVKRSKKHAKKEFERISKLTEEERAEEAKTAKMLAQVRQSHLDCKEDTAFEKFD